MPAVGGFVFDSAGAPVGRELRIYRRDTGALLGKARSSGGAGDPDFDKVALLLHMDGVDGSTIFTDSSAVPKTVTAASNAAIRTAQSKFGGASAYFDGSTAYITASGGAEYDLGTISTATNFTAEFWYRPGKVGAARQNLLFHAMPGSGGDGRGGWSLWAANGTLTLAISAVTTATNPWFYLLSTDSAVFAVSAWYHVALVMSAGVPTLYVDGVAAATTVGSGNAIYAATPIGLDTTKTTYGLRVGASYTDSSNPTPVGFAQGNIDELRITKGVARYTANFTPPSTPFLDMSGAGRTLAFGEYYFVTTHTGEVQVVCMDDANEPLENDLILRTFPV